MPRRRMIDPDFWSDSRIKKLNPTERLFFIGLISHADDEGRLLADPSYLRSQIFPYDDLTIDQIIAMRDRIIELNPNVHLYNLNGDDYLAFLQWTRYQKPSHPQPSKLPPPDKKYFKEVFTESIQEPFTEQNPNHSLLGQSSQGKVSIDKDSLAKVDFSEFLENEIELTDRLTTVLTEQISAGRTQSGIEEGTEQDASLRMRWGIQVLEKCWQDCIKDKMPTSIFEGLRHALRDYPITIVARAVAKGMRYQGGKHKSWKYFQAIIDEEMQKK